MRKLLNLKMNENKIKFINKLVDDNKKKENIFSKHKDIMTNGNMVPIEVSDLMISEIPEWVILSKESTFLIPFCGTGNFSISLLKRLLIYHEIEDSINRIYLCEESLSTLNFFLKNTGESRF